MRLEQIFALASPFAYAIIMAMNPPLRQNNSRTSILKMAFCIATLFAIFIAVAFFHRSSPNVGLASPSWSEVAPTEMLTPGLDQVSTTCGLWANGMAVVFWTDLQQTGFSTLTLEDTKDAKKAIYEAPFTSPNGEHYDCRCETSDGSHGSVTIAGNTFDLSEGSFFLISAATGPLQIVQLKRRTLNIKESDLKALAKTDPAIIQFYTEAARRRMNSKRITIASVTGS
jgi:hypothetical protein